MLAACAGGAVSIFFFFRLSYLLKSYRFIVFSIRLNEHNIVYDAFHLL